MHFHYRDDDACDCGWRVVDELDEDDMSYEWHTLVVMEHLPTGRLFWGEGSGCSCNSASDMELSEFAPIHATQGAYWGAVRDFPAKPDEKRPFFGMARGFLGSRFGAHVYVTSDGAFM